MQINLALCFALCLAVLASAVSANNVKGRERQIITTATATTIMTTTIGEQHQTSPQSLSATKRQEAFSDSGHQLVLEPSSQKGWRKLLADRKSSRTRRAGITNGPNSNDKTDSTPTGLSSQELVEEFIRVEPEVQTNLRMARLRANQSRLLGASASRQSASGANKRTSTMAQVETENWPPAASDKRQKLATNLESLNKFLLQSAQVSHDDEAEFKWDLRPKTGGAIYSNGDSSPSLLLPNRKSSSSWTENHAAKAMKSVMGTTVAPSQAFASTDYLASMYLDPSTELEARAHLGETAYLLCRLRPTRSFASTIPSGQQRGAASDQLQVSWVRSMQILTSGEFRYTSDQRFKPIHLGSNDWLLEIHNVQASDEGAYECQVNSEPKPASVTVELKVLAANVSILESPELHADNGDQIELTCRVEFRSQAQLADAKEDRANLRQLDNDAVQLELPPGMTSDYSPARHQIDRRWSSSRQLHASSASNANYNWQPYIYWYKDNVSLEYNNPRGNIEVRRRELIDGLESKLRLSGATRVDSGVYLCKLVPELSEVRPAQTRVFVSSSADSSLTSLALFNSFNWPKQPMLTLIVAIVMVALINSLATPAFVHNADGKNLPLC